MISIWAIRTYIHSRSMERNTSSFQSHICSAMRTTESTTPAIQGGTQQYHTNIHTINFTFGYLAQVSFRRTKTK